MVIVQAHAGGARDAKRSACKPEPMGALDKATVQRAVLRGSAAVTDGRRAAGAAAAARRAQLQEQNGSGISIRPLQAADRCASQ